MNPLSRTFINLQTDFGFKRLFGSPEHVKALKLLINTLFEGELRVTDIEFRNKEIIPAEPAGKKILYDVYCTTDTGHHFILEMQQEENENFKNRIVFYWASAMAQQGRRGINYDLQPVFLVALTTFNLSGIHKRLINDFSLRERTSGELYGKQLRIIFASLAMVPPEWEDCKTEIERVLYIIKNIETMDKNSEAYKSGKYYDIFDPAEIADLASEEAVAYSNSYYAMLDHQNALQFAERRAREEGIKEGMEKGMIKGMEKGMEKGILMTAKGMVDAGIPVSIINQVTGLSIKDIEQFSK